MCGLHAGFASNQQAAMSSLTSSVAAGVAGRLAVEAQLSAPPKALPTVPPAEALSALACPPEEALLNKYESERAWRKGKVSAERRSGAERSCGPSPPRATCSSAGKHCPLRAASQLAHVGTAPVHPCRL